MPDGGIVLSSRWTPIRYHPTQQAYIHSPHRFNVLPCGRRSGKTELFKRKLIRRAISASFPWPARYFAGAPVRAQAKRIFWDDLKALSPRNLIYDISEGELWIEYINGSRVHVVGMDAGQRIEGSPWDGGGMDEFASMRPNVWSLNIRLALADRNGWCDLFGVPEGRNHYWKIAMEARAEMLAKGVNSDWGYFHWTSEEILPPEEIEALKRELDDLSYAQECLASFVNFRGRAYYPFQTDSHTLPLRKLYNPKLPLGICFDFNVEPGVACVVQELPILSHGNVIVFGTAVIGEVWIPRNSNTPAVCRRLIADWGKHEGPVRLYGDASGGARGSAKVMGSDWDLIRAELTPVFRQKLELRVPNENPPERSRVNSVNARLRTADGRIHLLVDPQYAPHVVTDLEGVTLLEGGTGELDKRGERNKLLTHISDALGYYIHYEFPISGRDMAMLPLSGTPH